MSSKLRIGIVGAGGIVQQRHLPALLAMPNVEIVAVSNSTYASSERFCRDHLPRATPLKNWAELVALPDLDIVWIGTPPYMHAPVSISALEAGRHVFCQARMAMNLAESLEMLEAARKRPHLVTMLCPPPTGWAGICSYGSCWRRSSWDGFRKSACGACPRCFSTPLRRLIGGSASRSAA